MAQRLLTRSTVTIHHFSPSTILVFATGALALAVGCAPATTYRYTGVVPAPHPIAFDGRTSEQGAVRVEGTVTQSTVDENLAPQIHDTALQVASTTLDGSATYAVSDRVELGVRATYSAYSLTTPSAIGTMPIPSRPNMFGVGPELRTSIPLDREQRFQIGIAADLLMYQLPTATWTKAACTLSATCVNGDTNTPSPTTYQYVSADTNSIWLGALTALFSGSLGEHDKYGHLFGGFTFTEQLGNDGFTDTASSGGAIQTAGFLAIAEAGYGVNIWPMHVAATVFYPMTTSSSPIDLGPGMQLTLGVDLGGGAAHE